MRRRNRRLWPCLALAWPLGSGVAEAAEPSAKTSSNPPAPPAPRLHRYLTRDLAPSPRHLDHGVLGVAAAGGSPHYYRLAVGLGLLDHLTLGVTGHWLPNQRVPGWSPTVALAFFRARWIEAGATYHWGLFPPPEDDADPDTVSYQRRAQWFLAVVTLSQAWISAGADFGLVRGRRRDEFAIAMAEIEGDELLTTPLVVRNELGGGIHFRLGTRRLGVTGQVLWPFTTAELVLDVRFGLFEHRSRGGWWEY